MMYVENGLKRRQQIQELAERWDAEPDYDVHGNAVCPECEGHGKVILWQCQSSGCCHDPDLCDCDCDVEGCAYDYDPDWGDCGKCGGSGDFADYVARTYENPHMMKLIHLRYGAGWREVTQDGKHIQDYWTG